MNQTRELSSGGKFSPREGEATFDDETRLIAGLRLGGPRRLKSWCAATLRVSSP